MGKAFIVSAPDGENSAIIFAGSNIEARKWGAHEWNDGELGGMTCVRVPGLDQFAGGGVPASEMVRLGWWFECSNCGGRIDDEDTEERGVVPDDVIGTQHSLVYCNASCRDDHHARKAREKAVGDEFLAMMRGMVRRRFGEVDFCTGPFKEHMFAQEIDGIVLIRDACVSFTFPSQKIGPASMRYHPSYGTAVANMDVRCCFGDKEAFEAFAALPPPHLVDSWDAPQ